MNHGESLCIDLLSSVAPRLSSELNGGFTEIITLILERQLSLSLDVALHNSV